MQTTERAHGLILRTRPFTETSLIVNWLTPNFGRISTVAKGARRAKSIFRGKLDLFYEGDFSLREIVLRETNATLRHDLGYLHQASYCATLIEQTTEIQTPLPEIYELYFGFLRALPQQPPKPRTVFAFEFKLLQILGLSPDIAEIKLPAETRALVNALTETDCAPRPRRRTRLNNFSTGF
jgi:DNA repair protein RecO (recombination protein O)